jgi:hypothetical protein
MPIGDFREENNSTDVFDLKTNANNGVKYRNSVIDPLTNDKSESALLL